MFNKALKYGLIVFGCTFPILIGVFVFQMQRLASLQFILIIAATILVPFHLKKEQEGSILYKQVVRINYLTGLVLGFWMGLFSYLLYNYVDQELLSHLTDIVEQEYELKISDDELSSIKEGFSSPMYLIFANMIQYSLIFTVIGLIVGFFLKKDPIESQENN